jgi:hypothetical protein
VDTSDGANVDALAVEHIFDIAVDFDPMKIYPSPFGTRIDAIVRQGKADGPRLRGDILAGGGDWLLVGDDGVGRLDIRATIRTPDGDMVHLTSAGRTVLTEASRDRFLAGETITIDDLYGRTSPVFETASEAYSWLNGIVAVGVIVELSLTHIRYHVYALK